MRRLRTRFGVGGLSHSGMTLDISATGLFINSTFLPPLSAKLLIDVETAPENHDFLEGVVVRHVVVPPELRSVRRQGFGVRVRRTEEVMRDLLPASASPGLSLVVGSLDELRVLWARDFKQGGALVKSGTRLVHDQEVLLDVGLSWLQQQHQWPARVVHCTPDGAGSYSVMVLFASPQAKKTLEAALGGAGATEAAASP